MAGWEMRKNKREKFQAIRARKEGGGKTNSEDDKLKM